MLVASRRGNAALAVAALLVAAMPLYASAYHLQLASAALVAAMLALSLQLLVGGAGMVSLGQAAFFGLGAYAVYLLTPKGDAASVLVTLPAAAGLAGAAAFLIGLLALRTRGFSFLMITLAFGQMLYFLFHDTGLGGGADGVFVARPVFSLLGHVWEVRRAARPATYLLVNLAVLAAMYAGLAALMRTLFGHALLGIRANEHRMASLGHDVRRLKLAAFTLAGALAGVAGHMAVLTDAFVSPEMLGWHRSAEALLMILLGGIGALHGPLLGAAAYTLLGEVSQLVTERQRLVEGVVILLAVLLMPGGLAGLRLPRLRPRDPVRVPAEQ